MNAEVISVGTELLLGQIVDTDAAYVAQSLTPVGISLYHRATVGDNVARLKETLALAFSRADLVITIGGLGPTMDDLTKETTAEVLGVDLVEDAPHADRLRNLAESRGWGHLDDAFMKQALVPAQGRGLPNPNGTALGAVFESGNKIAICLPGPPNELIPMMDDHVTPYLAVKTLVERAVIKSRILRIVGMGESSVEERVRDLMALPNPTVAPYAKQGEVHLRVTARASTDSEAESLIAPVASQITERLGTAVYGLDDQTLESVVVSLLQEQGKTLAVAESCSGGLIAKRITDVPDASRIFGLGIVAYANEAKVKQLGVPESLLTQHGAVSGDVAKAMARGARAAASADIGVSVTGIAGPGGGSVEKPVGTVIVGITWGPHAHAERYQFLGRRADIAFRSSQVALALVRRLLISPSDGIADAVTGQPE